MSTREVDLTGQRQRITSLGGGILGRRIQTETALTAFALVPAAVGGLGQIIASRRLAQVSGDTVSVAQMILPVGLAVAGGVVSAVLVPTNG